MKVSLFIVDDHYMVIEGIRSLLQSDEEIDWAGHASNGASCLAFLRQQQPDVILLDINLPDINGIDLCKEIKKTYPGIFIIGLSTFNQETYVRKMLEYGASGYVLKNATRQELKDAIRQVMQGKVYLSEQVATLIRDNPEKKKPVITAREKEVLELVARGLTNPEIAQKIFLSTTTIDTHRKNLLSKLNARNTAELIRIAAAYQLISLDLDEK